MTCTHFHLCYYYCLFFSEDIFRYITDTCLDCVVWRPAESTWKIRTIGVQHLYRDWNWGISDEFCSKCSVSIEVCLTLFCIFGLICSMFGSSCCEHWTIEFIRRQQGTAHVLLYFISCITMYGTGQKNIIHLSLPCIIYHCNTMHVTRYADIIWISDHVSPDDSASPRQEIAELEVRLRQCAVFFQLIPVPEWWDGGQSGYAQEESYHVYLDDFLQWRGLLKTST